MKPDNRAKRAIPVKPDDKAKRVIPVKPDNKAKRATPERQVHRDRTADGKDGKDGIGIAKAEINADGELVITYTDGEVVNLGKVVGADGKDGLTPFIGENGNWWIGEKDTGVKAVADVAVPAGFGNISEPASSPALVAIGSVAGVALLGNLGLILYIVLKKKKV